MRRPVSLYLICLFLLFGCFCHLPASAGSEPHKVILMANEEYVGTIDRPKTRYLKITLINLAEEASTCRIAFYRDRIALSAAQMGPAEFRTFTLETVNDSQTRIWTTLNFDEFTVNVDSGKIEVSLETPMHIR